MALEKVYPPTDVNVLKKSKFSLYFPILFIFYVIFDWIIWPFIQIAGKIGDNRPAMKISSMKEKYEE